MTKESDEVHFKSPLDAELAKHGRRYGWLVHFANEAIKHDLVHHLPVQAPYLHNHNGTALVYDEACVRCNLEKSIEHANRDGWVGLEWQGGVDESQEGKATE